MSGTNTDRLLALAEERGILRTREVEDEDIPRQTLSRLVDRGDLVRIGRGLYRRPDHEVTAHHSLAVAAKRVPEGTVCLLSALQFHGLTTQNPLDVWLAIGHKDRNPKVDAVSLRIVRMSGEARTEGIETHEIEGVSVPIYESAKTVADCFKYRSCVGLDVALEALRDFHDQGGSIDALWHYADLCRVQTVIRPYMEAVTSWAAPASSIRFEITWAVHATIHNTVPRRGGDPQRARDHSGAFTVKRTRFLP